TSLGQSTTAPVCVRAIAAKPREFVQNPFAVVSPHDVFAPFAPWVDGGPVRLGQAEDIPPSAAGHIHMIGAEMRMRQPSLFEADMGLAVPRPDLARLRRDKTVGIGKRARKQANLVPWHAQVREQGAGSGEGRTAQPRPFIDHQKVSMTKHAKLIGKLTLQDWTTIKRMAARTQGDAFHAPALRLQFCGNACRKTGADATQADAHRPPD